MRGKRARFEFRMKLRTQIKWMIFLWQFGNFHQRAIWRNSGENQSGFLKLFDIFIIDFIAVPMTFGDFCLTIRCGSKASAF